MTRWRSLFVTGVVLVGLVLVGAQSASAQGALADARVVMGTGTGTVDVTWTISTPLLVGDMIELEHRVYSATQGANVGWTGRVELGLTAVKHTLTGLDHTKMYQARVRINPAVSGNPTEWVVTSDDSGTTDVDEEKASPRAPTMPVRVASPAVTAGDAMLMVEWLEPASELPITLYRVYYTPKGGTAMEKIVLAPDTSTTLTSLVNGTEYTIEVAAESSAGLGPKSAKVMGTPMAGAGSDDDDDDDMPMETPAVPLVGLLLLGAGLVAAGRRRLQR